MSRLSFVPLSSQYTVYISGVPQRCSRMSRVRLAKLLLENSTHEVYMQKWLTAHGVLEDFTDEIHK
jgi:hypothetical protein